MILLPYMYGNLFLRNADGTFTAFRLGTHGKQRIEALEEATKGMTTEQIRKNAYRRLFRFYLKETPVERMFHKILYTDGFIFIADEMYQPDERKSLTDTGYLIALKAWKEILEWAETEQFFETGVGEPLGIQVFLSSKMLHKLEIDDAQNASDPSLYREVHINQKKSYMVTDISLNKIDSDGYPSWKSSELHRNKTYRSVVCYAGISPMVPSFTNVESSKNYTYLHRLELEHNTEFDGGDGGLGYYTFYEAAPGVIGKALYKGFTCATLLQTPVWVVNSSGEREATWEDPNLKKPVRVLIPKVTVEDLEKIRDYNR